MESKLDNWNMVKAGILTMVIMVGAGFGLQYSAKKYEEKQCKKQLIPYVDINQDGVLSKYENYKLDSLMNILDKSDNYKPSLKEFKTLLDKLGKN